MTIRTVRGFSALTTLLLLSVPAGTAPHASQEEAKNDFILFSTDRDNPSELTVCAACEEIYVMEPDGYRQTRITSNDANDSAPDWSRRRETIAFHSNRREPLRRPEIFLMNLDGTDQRVVASLGAAGAAFASFSPDGNKICFQSQTPPRDIYIVDIDGTGLTNLTSPEQPGANGDNLRCDWSPKGNDIAFVSSRTGDQEIFVINADGSKLVRLTTEPGRDANPAWSPNGDWIAFESNRDGNAEIYVMSAHGRKLTRLTFFDAIDTKPSWSPNGDRVAFHRQIGDHNQVFTMNTDGSDITQITFTPTPGTSGFPSWGTSRTEF
jgi:TolB protein